MSERTFSRDPKGSTPRPPQILALADVHLKAAIGQAAELSSFYVDLLGLVWVSPAGGGRLSFVGHPRRGPRLTVELLPAAPPPRLRRQLLLQVSSLAETAERLLEEAIPLAWSSGWSTYDRRLTALDPAANRVELVSGHWFG